LSSIREQKFRNFIIDLIYGFDNQDVNSFLEDVETAINFKAGHITLYPLIKSAESKEDEERKQIEMYRAAQVLLKQQGYKQYSVEDFAINDSHKIDYQIDAWGVPSKDIILIGTSSFGALNGHFYQKEKSVKKYIEQINKNVWPVGFVKKVNSKQEHLRRLIFGLHYIDVDRNVYMQKYGVDIVKEWRWMLWFMKVSGLIEITDKKISLSKSQWFKASQLWGKILFELL
jgi:coproporphyrinogen III oxidase-like Fe-S oxidoreductase